MNISDRAEKLSQKLDDLIERAELWQLLFDACPLAIAVFTVDMKFFMINVTFSELTGYEKPAVIGQHLSKVLPLGFRREHKKHEKNFVANPRRIKNHSPLTKILTKDFEEVPVEVYLSYFNHDDKVYYAAFINEMSK